MTPEDLVETLAAAGVIVRLPEARRVIGRVIAEGASDVMPRRAVSRATVAAVEAHTSRSRPEVVERAVDPDDGFVKYLLKCADGAEHEAVRIPLHKPGCYTVCLSSQVGCAMR